MAMDEFAAVMKARELVRVVNPAAIPAPMEAYVERVGAVLKVDMNLDENEPGWSFENKGKKYICVNGKDSPERQRFTIGHELAHIVLGLPSEHQQVPSWNFAKRSPNEILCDVFAAELLLPYGLSKPLAEKSAICLASVDTLAGSFVASTMATGSRFATVLRGPCAFVVSESGRVRYAARSAALRDARAWIAPRIEVPLTSLSARLRAGTASDGPEEIEAEEWFQHWERGGTLLEEARHLERWDQIVMVRRRGSPGAEVPIMGRRSAGRRRERRFVEGTRRRSPVAGKKTPAVNCPALHTAGSLRCLAGPSLATIRSCQRSAKSRASGRSPEASSAR